MQRYRVIIADDVFDQLDRIFDFVKRQSPQNARRLVERLLDAMADLNTLPMRYPAAALTRFAGLEYRKRIVGPHRIVYRVDEARSVVYVLDVTHGAQDTR